MPLADRDALFALVKKSVAKEIGEKNKYLRAKDAGWAELLAAAGARYASGDATSPLDEAVESTIGDRLDLELMLQWWHVKEGPAFAVKAWAHTWRWDPWGHAFENPGEAIYRYGHNASAEYLQVRRWVATLDAASYAEARDAAKAIRDLAPLTLRCGLACAFVDESTWAAADADEITTLAGAAVHPVFARPGFVVGVLASLRDEARITVLAKQVEKETREVRSIAADLARLAGDSAVDALARFIDVGDRGDASTEFAKAVASVASPRAAHALASRLDDKAVRRVALELFTADVALAVPALARVLCGPGKAGKAADPAARAVVQVAASDHAAFDAALAKLAPGERNAITAVLDKLAIGVEATEGELPAVLRDPPWLRKNAKTVPIPTIALTVLPIDEAVTYEPGAMGQYDQPLPRTTPLIEVESLVRWKNLPEAKERSKEMDDFVVKAFAKSNPDDYFKRVHYVSTMLHVCTDATALRLLNGAVSLRARAGELEGRSPSNVNEEDPQKLGDANLHDLEYLLSRFELRGLTGLIALATAQPARLAALVRVASPRLAPLMAEAHLRMKKIGPIAREWLARWPEHAATGLIPLALGSEKASRAAATSALRWMSLHGHESVLRTVADRYGTPARAAVDVILAFDPLTDVPAKMPKPPAWLKSDALPRAVLREGKKALPLSAMTHLLTMLQFTGLDPVYAGLALVKEACAPESLAELAWALFNEWMLAGAAGKEDWALMALGHFGNDETARRLGPKIRVWPGESAHARAVKGLDVLAIIGTDIALMQLDGIAQKLKFKGLQEKAKEKIAEVAESRGFTREELADRLVPDMDLDADGTKLLSFGARTFRASFDEQLRPFVVDASGKRQKDLPKPGKADDAEKAAASIAWWKATKKDAKTIATQQLLRLELAMCTRRTWDVATFTSFLVEPPLVFLLARRLVWATYEADQPTATFRIAEDRSLADVHDELFVLDPGAAVGIVHLLDLDPDVAATWGARLGEYELIQPFAQLTREVFRPTEAEREAQSLDRYKGAKVPLGRVLGLEQRGWRRGAPQDAGWIWDMEKALDGGLIVTLDLDGGILAGAMSESPAEQGLGALTLTKRGGEVVTFGALPGLAFSELVCDIHELTR